MLSALLLAACAGQPERTESSAMSRLLPWGALPSKTLLEPEDPVIAERIAQRMQAKIEASEDAQIPYRVLAMSGGGPRGAYGAGVLSGWTLTGQRPEFDVVTGVSVGALMATYAFLGSGYDEQLQQDAYGASLALAERRFRLGATRRAALFEGEGLTELLNNSITDELLDAVAREYRKGRRLFVGTTNLDNRRFTIWDMGHIANSDRPDRVQHYRNVLLASAAVPLYFPPTMFQLETTGANDRQMHVDGGVYKNIFVSDFNGTLFRALEANQLSKKDLAIELYVLVNGQLNVEQPPPPVRKSLFPVAATSVSTLMRANSATGVYKLWIMAMLGGARFSLTYIPASVQFHTTLTGLDLEEMRQLFMLGFEKGRTQGAWQVQTAPEDIDEIREVFSLDTLENLFWLYFEPEPVPK